MIIQPTIDAIISFFESTNKDVITFIGYSGTGYEDKKAMLEIAENILEEFDPSLAIINIGATIQGIGIVYEVAKGQGYTTTGIVSTQARKYNIELSPYVDHVFYVEDSTWGGFIGEGDQLSPTSKVILAISDMLIGIGGGEIGRDELLAAKQIGKEVRFYPADMNHMLAREKAQKKGLPEPIDFGGAAGDVFKQ